MNFKVQHSWSQSTVSTLYHVTLGARWSVLTAEIKIIFHYSDSLKIQTGFKIYFHQLWATADWTVNNLVCHSGFEPQPTGQSVPPHSLWCITNKQQGRPEAGTFQQGQEHWSTSTDDNLMNKLSRRNQWHRGSRSQPANWLVRQCQRCSHSQGHFK